MTDSSQLDPLDSRSFALTPASALAKLIPEKVISLWDSKIYWLQRNTTSCRSDPVDCAMLSMKKSEKTFTLSYYPAKDSPQIVKELEIAQLPAVVCELILAGFPCRRDPAAKPDNVPPNHLQIEPLDSPIDELKE